MVRAFLYGEKHAVCAALLNVSEAVFYHVCRGPHWRELQNQFRDEFLNTTGNRLIRLEQKVMNQIEDFLDNGVDGVSQTGQHYNRGLSPREAAVIARTLAETNKRIDKIREGDVTRKTFNFADRIRSLERAAEAKTIDGERAA